MNRDRIRIFTLDPLGWLVVAVAISLIGVPHATAGTIVANVQNGEVPTYVPLDDFSPGFLGIYRKLIEIEADILRYAEKYGLDPGLARAVCMYESGGNANLTSWAGARGYFQVMPATFRALRVPTNIEAGVKYLAQLVKQFGREDYALAAYNGGPGRVARGRPMPLESLQYVLGVGHYRTVLQLHEESVRYHAQQLKLETVHEGDDWWGLSRRLNVHLLQLRVHNPFLTDRPLRAGQLIAYPAQPRTELLSVGEGDAVEYRTRLGDNYFNLAFTLDIDLDLLRSANGLWHLQTLPAGLPLRLPLSRSEKYDVHRVQSGDTLEAVAKRAAADPWQIIRDNNLFSDAPLREGTMLKIRPAPPKPAYTVYHVQTGDNLGAIAERFGTTVSAIQSLNSMGGSTLIRIGQALRIPSK